MENYNIFLTPAFDKYDDLSKAKYKMFVPNLFKLGRETKRTQNESLTIEMIRLDGEPINIYYSIENNSWIINNEKFNPKAISGVMKFLNDFHIIDIENTIMVFESQING